MRGDTRKRDFPYYRGRPVALCGWRWGLLMLAVAAGFAVLIAPPLQFKSPVAQFIPALLFPAIPLGALALLAPRGWTALFGPVGPRDVGLMFVFAAANIVVSLVLGFVVMKLSGANANPVIAAMGQMGDRDLLLFFVRTVPQLLGEEVVTMLPLLAMLTLFTTKLKWARGPAVGAAFFLSAMLFGALHLPTYGWNLLQCLVVIGGARLMLTLPYLMTKNLWVSTGAHIVNDWSLFALALVVGALA